MHTHYRQLPIMSSSLFRQTKAEVVERDVLWRETLTDIWFKEIKPYREAKIAERMNADVDVELSDREVIAESNMPSIRELKVLQTITNYSPFAYLK